MTNTTKSIPPKSLCTLVVYTTCCNEALPFYTLARIIALATFTFSPPLSDLILNGQPNILTAHRNKWITILLCCYKKHAHTLFSEKRYQCNHEWQFKVALMVLESRKQDRSTCTVRQNRSSTFYHAIHAVLVLNQHQNLYFI